MPLNKFEEGKEYVVPIRRALLLSASEIKFGPVRPTERARRTLAIKNTWGANIAVTLSDPIGNIFAWIPVHNRPLAKDASMNVDLDFLPLRARGRCWAPSLSPPSTARERSSWRAASSPSPVRSPELRHLLHTDFQIVGQLGHSALPAGPAKNSEGCRHVAAEEEELDSSADGEL